MKAQPVFSKRVAPNRSPPRRRLKIPDVRVGQIVYCIRWDEIVPMYLGLISDEGFWLFPMVKKNGIWVIKKFVFNSLKLENLNVELWDAGFIGNAIDRDEFCITHAEAKWSKMRYRVSPEVIHKRYKKLMDLFHDLKEEDGLS